MNEKTPSTDRMQLLKRYVVANFEQFFVLLILLSVSGITYFLPYKLAFLNFFYIPILLAASYLGTRQAVMGAIFSLVLVTIYAILYPLEFVSASGRTDLFAQIGAWGCFLVLSGAVVGYLNQQLKAKILEATLLDDQLTDHKDLLEKTTRELMEHTEHLEARVAERTEGLRKSKLAVEEHKHKVEEALYSTMDPEVVKLMIEKRLRTEKRRLSVLFCDLEHFTTYAEEKRPEVVVTDLNSFLADMEEILLTYRGHIDKYLGDGIMAEFGAPIDYDRHALMAVACGLKMQERATAASYPWAMRVGIATGEATLGLIGKQRQSYTALGDVVNLSARIEELCHPGTVTLDDKTYGDIRSFFELRRQTTLPLNGLADDGIGQQISTALDALDASPLDVDCLKRAARLMLEAGHAQPAADYFKQAVEVAPDDREAKLGYAEASLQAEHADDVQVRGRSKPVHLYEVVGLKDPLLDRERIPQALYDAYHESVDRICRYPEDIILPVECIDGSIGHGRTVGFLTGVLAQVLELPEKNQHDMVEAGYLAEIGKSIVPHHVLNRRGSLRDDEAKGMNAVGRESVRKLRSMGYTSSSVFEIIMAHDENFDGSGPKGMAGEQIPLGARILRIMEVYSALTSWRSYRDRWDARAAYNEVADQARQGKLDPDLTARFGQVLGFSNQAQQLG